MERGGGGQSLGEKSSEGRRIKKNSDMSAKIVNFLLTPSLGYTVSIHTLCINLVTYIITWKPLIVKLSSFTSHILL